MKILFIVNSDLGKHGTIGFRTYHIVKEAIAQGHEVKIIARGNKSELKIIKIFPFYRLINLGMSAFSQFIYPKFNARQVQLTMFDNACCKKLEKADVLHIIEYAPKTIKKAKELGMKVIMDTQLPYSQSAEMDECLKLADIVTCGSPYSAQSYNHRNIKVIPFGADTDAFCVNLFKSEKMTYLYVGSVEERKGIEYLMQAWDELNLADCELYICGRIHKRLKAKIQDYLKKHKSVRFTGFINPADYYLLADVFVYPSLVDGSAKSTYEAMSSGLPMITTFNAGSVVRDNIDGFIIPIKDVNAIKEKMLFFYNNQELAKSMGINARTNIEQNYTWVHYGKKCMEVIENGSNICGSENR